MRKYILIPAAALLLLFGACGKPFEETPIFMPADERARIQFISYVTNQKKELLHTMEYIDRQYVEADTIGDRVEHRFIEKNRVLRYFTEPGGAIRLEVQVDLASYALQGGYRYQAPVLFSYWKTVFDRQDGLGTSWRFKADTTFSVLDSLGRTHALRYTASGRAKLVGRTKIIVPANREQPLDVIQVSWPEFENRLQDLTSGEEVWRQRGRASDFFEKRFGLVRTMADYTMQIRSQPSIERSSTYELYLAILPE